MAEQKHADGTEDQRDGHEDQAEFRFAAKNISTSDVVFTIGLPKYALYAIVLL